MASSDVFNIHWVYSDKKHTLSLLLSAICKWFVSAFWVLNSWFLFERNLPYSLGKQWYALLEEWRSRLIVMRWVVINLQDSHYCNDVISCQVSIFTFHNIHYFKTSVSFIDWLYSRLAFHDLKIVPKNCFDLYMGQKLRAKHQFNKFFTISIIIVFIC